MKKKLIRGIAVVLCLVLCFVLAGCGASLGSMLILRNCLKAVSAAENVSFTYHADGEADLAGEDAVIRLDGDGVWYTAPFALTLDTDAELRGIAGVSAPIILTNEDGRLVTYFGVDPAGDPLWIRTVKDSAPADAPEFDLMDVLARYGQSGGASVEDDETDSSLLRVSIALPGRLLAPEAETEPDDVQLSIWIDKKTELPARMRADLAPLARQLLERSGNQYAAFLTVKSLPVEITFTALDKAEPFAPPAPERVILDLDAEKEPAAMPSPAPVNGTGADRA